jgi:aminoglycoside phosphotransferase (APT) family kinase protein
VDIVERRTDAHDAARPPLVILEAIRSFLDAHALGAGALQAHRIGEGGGSNFSFLLERGDGTRYVLRRPPRPPLPPSAHDVVRESALQLALAPLGIRVPNIRAVCEDDSLLGVPFYVMDYIDGDVVTTALPPPLDHDPEARRLLADDLVDTLVEIHAADVSLPGLAVFLRPGNYNDRQVRRFAQLWEMNKTRDLPTVVKVGQWLAANVPDQLPAAVVHGDYRLGNMIVTHEEPERVAAVLDWEMGAIGDPRADVGYLVATYSEPGGRENPLGTSPVTAMEGFPTRREMVERYTSRSGRDVEPLAWFEALALWKAAVFCEAIYGRYLRGELTADDRGASRFEAGVPLLAETAAELVGA